MTKAVLAASIVGLATAQASFAGGMEDPVITPPVIIEDMAATPSLGGQTLVLLSALVVFTTAASTK